MDFIYVNANTGEAAGGHTALRLGSTVFHYQFFPQGQFLLVRHSWSHFRYIYNELRNRSIFIAKLPLTQPVYAEIKGHFTAHLILQQQDLHHLKNAEIQLNLAIQLANNDQQLALETVGLFNRDETDNTHMRRLRQIIIRQLGDNAIKHRQQQVNKNLVKLASQQKKQTDTTSWLTKLQALLLEREFLHLVKIGAFLAPDSIFSPPEETPELTTKQQEILRDYQDKLTTSIVGLLQSHRPDRAKSLMRQMARYLIVSYSLETDTLLTLDPFSAAANSVLIQNNDEHVGLLAQLQQNTLRTQNAFFKETTYPDIAYTLMESSQGRWHELAMASQQGNLARIEHGPLLPARKGTISLNHLSFTSSELPELVTDTETRLILIQQQIEEGYSYNLIKQNCVTELLRTLNSTFDDPKTGHNALGGWVEPNDNWAFIPNRFYQLINQQFPIQTEETHPARRLRELAAMTEHTDSLSIWARESNTLSSTLYTPRTDDTAFLFFTDDTLLLRPILGIANLLWATANSIGGIFTAPIDGGEQLHQGLRGMFYSLPELEFSNIRKGTYGFVETDTTGP